jgi:hypothetical protein
LWHSIVHHVAGQHSWADFFGGITQCQHGPISDSIDMSKPILEKGSDAWRKFRDIVLDPKLISDLKYYIDFL